MFPLVFLVACATPTEADSALHFEAGEASEPRHPEAAYSAQEAADALVAGFQYGFPMPGPVLDLWRFFLSKGDDGCPGGGWIGGGLSTTQVNGCVAESGYWYSGVGGGGLGWTFESRDGEPPGFYLALKTDGTMADPEGIPFFFGGDLYVYVEGTQEEGGPLDGYSLGTYGYGGSDVPWLREGFSAATYFTGNMGPQGEWDLVINGGFTIDGVAVSMEDFGLHGACGDNPTGKIGVRDPAGYWYDLTFDETTCDGCGAVVFDGRTELGNACADVTPAFLEAMDNLAAIVGIGTVPK